MQNFGTAGAQKRSKIISTRGTTSELSHTSPRLSGFPHRPRVRGPVVRHLGAMVLSPPAPTRRRGSLRASDVPSGSTSHSSSMSTESGAAAEAMRAVAARLEKHTGVLRSVLEKVSFLDDPASAACKPSPAVAAKKALEAGRRVSSSCESSSSDDDDEFEQAQAARLQSYQRADVYIKKAAGKIAGHRGWTTQNSGDSKRSITEALEELKLASMVLQRRHDADAAGGGIVWKQKRSRIKPNSSDVASSSPRHTDVVSTQQNVTRTHQVVMQRVKDALKPLELTTEALQKTAGRLCADADKCETFDLSLKKKIDELKKQRNDAMAEAAREKTLRETAPAKIVKVLVGPTETEKRADLRKQKEALEKEKAEKKQKESASVLETEKENSQNSAETKPNPDAELMAKLRVATEQRDDFAQKLRRVTITCDTETHALSASVRDAARRTQEAMDKARAAHEEKERWRALYVAVRSDFAGGVGKVEADALRAATRKSEDTRRRELSLLGAEHGNQCASLKRALADAERRVNEMVPQLEKAERKQKEASESLENEKNATETAEHKARLMHGELKRCAQKLEVLELDLASTQLKLEQTERHSLELQKHETVARLAITKELETERLANSKHDDWRVRAAEAKFLAAASTAKREKDRADTAEQLLDEERRAVVDQHAVVAGNAMADAVRRWGGTGGE
jgi:hypothetical protein